MKLLVSVWTFGVRIQTTAEPSFCQSLQTGPEIQQAFYPRGIGRAFVYVVRPDWGALSEAQMLQGHGPLSFFTCGT